MLLSIVIAIVGCESENKGLYIEETADIDRKNYNMMSEVRMDLDGNGVEELISLYLGPVKQSQANMAVLKTDDANWNLIVQDGEKVFSLFNHKVKHGTVEFWFENNEDGIKIVLFVDGEQKEIITYQYDRGNSRFIKETHYKNNGIVYEPYMRY
jgi:hypothetical protein